MAGQGRDPLSNDRTAIGADSAAGEPYRSTALRIHGFKNIPTGIEIRPFSPHLRVI